ncbi:MAG TPA: TerB family tellurite resistance protein [Hydrogenophaga sp.]|uniref:tellurite resistance TerB family protein n=1 Tax=Hydrogenophaga sp. TaxID=1904254 RepID=UPI002B6E541E|nr:TerB family tellurite resistance protein [Hydrogenophaga sp.]HMN93803.1 TerB family tellurite resistance protein [Hydrogenophaga sp.]HMP09674.1 TerB family tellurite resistance protein [Hydrogenophaga sp.]
MLRTLKDLFDQLGASLAPDAPRVDPRIDEHQLQLATAVLLVEVMRAEPTFSESERDAVLLALRGKFDLADDELERLLELAHDNARIAYDYQRFTARLNERFSQPQKIRVIEAMWQVAYADGHLDVHENQVISKVAGLLHVTHGEYIAAKMRAQEDAGLR